LARFAVRAFLFTARIAAARSSLARTSSAIAKIRGSPGRSDYHVKRFQNGGTVMNKFINIVACLVAAALLCVASVSPSQAQTTAYVSGKGLDANACTLSAPCKTIGHAFSAAGPGGTVTCLDAGPYTEGFAPVTNSPFTLDCRGVVYNSGSGFAVVMPGGGFAPVATFRHVIFDGSAGGGGAVKINGGSAVFEDCTFQNFTASPGEAVQFAPSVAGSYLAIRDSVFLNNGVAAGGGGVIIQPSGGVKATAVIERTQVTGNTYGIVANGAGGTVLVDIRYSSVAGSALDGIWAYTTGPVTSIVVEHSASVRNGGNGINATGANAYVSLNGSTSDWNGTGLATSSAGTVLSYQNNLFGGNVSPGVTPVSVSQQ
jgi:hypothetical protein